MKRRKLWLAATQCISLSGFSWLLHHPRCQQQPSRAQQWRGVETPVCAVHQRRIFGHALTYALPLTHFQRGAQHLAAPPPAASPFRIHLSPTNPYPYPGKEHTTGGVQAAVWRQSQLLLPSPIYPSPIQSPFPAKSAPAARCAAGHLAASRAAPTAPPTAAAARCAPPALSALPHALAQGSMQQVGCPCYPQLMKSLLYAPSAQRGHALRAELLTVPNTWRQNDVCFKQLCLPLVMTLRLSHRLVTPSRVLRTSGLTR